MIYDNDWNFIHFPALSRRITALHCHKSRAQFKWEENTAGAEDSKTSSPGLKKAVLVQGKEAIIFSTQQTDKALLQRW